jgi:hypothetical protein
MVTEGINQPELSEPRMILNNNNNNNDDDDIKVIGEFVLFICIIEI